MPVALVPEGFKLQKVSKQQQQALDNFNNKEIIKTLASSGSSGIAVLTIGALVAYALYKGVKFPNLDIVQSFATAFPQLSAVLGIERELTSEQATAIRELLEDPSQLPWIAGLFNDKKISEIGKFG